MRSLSFGSVSGCAAPHVPGKEMVVPSGTATCRSTVKEFESYFLALRASEWVKSL